MLRTFSIIIFFSRISTRSIAFYFSEGEKKKAVFTILMNPGSTYCVVLALWVHCGLLCMIIESSGWLRVRCTHDALKPPWRDVMRSRRKPRYAIRKPAACADSLLLPQDLLNTTYFNCLISPLSPSSGAKQRRQAANRSAQGNSIAAASLGGSFWLGLSVINYD